MGDGGLQTAPSGQSVIRGENEQVRSLLCQKKPTRVGTLGVALVVAPACAPDDAPDGCSEGQRTRIGGGGLH